MPRRSDVSFTKKYVAATKPPKGGVKDLWDRSTPGFGLRVFARRKDGGFRRTWCLMDRLGGKQRRWTIGQYPVMNVDQARAIAVGWKNKIGDGIDPALETVASQPAVEIAVKTFGAIAEDYFANECPRLARGREVESIIRRELMPHWASRPIDTIKKRDARERTTALVEAGKPSAAHRLHEITKRVFNWAVEHIDEDELGFEVPPVANLKQPVHKEPRSRKLSDDELRAVWEACGRQETGFPYGPIVRMLILTGQRKSEVAKMLWSEVHFDRKEWTIPAERSKSKREHIVPLSDMAVALLESLPRLTDARDGFVFSTTRGSRPFSGFSKSKQRLDALCGVKRWRLHDVRRTVRSNLARLGIVEIVSERILNHAPRGLVGVYNVHEYTKEKRHALDLWAKTLREIIEPPPENVVEMLGREAGR